jgi:hypothetical protein
MEYESHDVFLFLMQPSLRSPDRLEAALLPHSLPEVEEDANSEEDEV